MIKSCSKPTWKGFVLKKKKELKENSLDDLDLDKVRLNIIKTMLEDFPQLKLQIRNILTVEPKNEVQESRRIELREFLKSPSEDTIPDWIKLAVASKKKDQNKKEYYFFR